jgi:hypothetical protein
VGVIAGGTTLISLLSVILGAALSETSRLLGDLRTADREKLSRLEQRRDATNLRRVEFQRATLLELQEVVAQNLRFNGRAHLEDKRAFKTAGVWGRQPLGPDINDGLFHTQVRLRLLNERVRDARTRKIADDYVDACVAAGLSRSVADADANMALLTDTVMRLQSRIGVVLRSLDDDEDHLLDGPASP